MTSLSPREIVSELDRFIIGQHDAKKAVAIALRNRWRRQQLEPNLRDEVMPKNILMIGPTGCGKTEISRRLAKLANAPFIKVEATKFTEIGYVGRDVDSIIRDLLEIAIHQLREKSHASVQARAEQHAEDRIIEALVGATASEETKQKFRTKLREGTIENQEISLEVADTASPFNSIDIPGMPGAQMGMLNLGDMMGKAFGNRTKTRTLTVAEARELLLDEEADKLVDHDAMIEEAIDLTENHGIVFLDEIDKIAVRSEARGGEVSREGVQRDLLPLIEGTTVTTKHGAVKTDHILFIASGAFHQSKPSDLLPELQGRLPIRVELKPLTKDDMVRILTETEASLLKQASALMATESVTLSFTEEAVADIAELATKVNREVENIGARRLHTMLEKLLEELSFTAADTPGKTVSIDSTYVHTQLDALAGDNDVSRFIL
jgi:ATP-dependent HslUV protease ATP-binding subunit HslU